MTRHLDRERAGPSGARRQPDPGLLARELHFPFRLDARLAGLLGRFRPHQERHGVWVDAKGLTVRFGPCTVHTPLSNILDARVTGPYAAWRVLGARLSLADRGLTFGTNTAMGVCVHFRQPVRGLDPFGLLRHPALTVTVAEPQLLARWLRANAAAAGD
ncbi:hypothetical protein [Amycolatopsis aidingensis]|uniref:hypothetical protein n=1 Tax=Amycolatopsis aidingensis TaxID=2842453 RepID=UPI001C0DF326|nr:hypothetical protein [Amycolatopsis aidingensis]